ncbi:hypothetical protein QF035_002046 [Streptomyces umbrinus]|uniref:HTH lacI-type domain-containing protein n=1 Tax=Streptomyces umbrinus TaxID=67370 RepID=A0ABU0SLQ1_9ACTN|nr:hypothetical protein [Streptomyces umbrinus]
MTRRHAQVAKKVGVSRVLNGKPGVSDTTRQAVLPALDVLGYERPTQLRAERARLVGLVLPEDAGLDPGQPPATGNTVTVTLPDGAKPRCLRLNGTADTGRPAGQFSAVEAYLN